jgi:sortase A
VNRRSRILRDAHRLFLWGGIVLLAYSGATIAYSEAYQRYQSRKFDQAVRRMPKEVRDLQEGEVVAKLEIPRIGLSVMVLQGIEESTLALGAGHVPGTSLPGSEGNVVIAAHRDTFFRKLSGIVFGDTIRVSVGNRVFEYTVVSTEIVDPENTRVMESQDRREITLITCYPFYFVGAAPKRFVVHGRPSAPFVGAGLSY